uniref:Uncharacterized protein DDB_G0273453/DDB_G0273565-like n=1 Tax=Rhizophora mucronata TaxID=61149 RepID=A0A2P2LWI4_RHIMU
MEVDTTLLVAAPQGHLMDLLRSSRRNIRSMAVMRKLMINLSWIVMMIFLELMSVTMKRLGRLMRSQQSPMKSMMI